MRVASYTSTWKCEASTDLGSTGVFFYSLACRCRKILHILRQNCNKQQMIAILQGIYRCVHSKHRKVTENHMPDIVVVGLYALAGGVISLLGAVLLLGKQISEQALERYALPFAAGALLAAAFLDLLKDGIEESDANTVLVSALAGVIAFFVAEKFLRWFHHHHQHGSDPAVGLIIAGDAIHNALDGVAIAAAFLVSVPAGVTTTIAVAAHEIPHEIGTFGLLLHKGVPRLKVLLLNVASGLGTVAMALLTYAIGSEESLPIGVLIGAGFLLYIAMSDVIPELHEHTPAKRPIDLQPVLLLLGVLTVVVAMHFARILAGGDV